MRLNQRSSAILTGSTLGLLFPSTCLAAAGAQALAGFVQVHIIQQALAAFWGIAAAAVFYYGVRMVVEAHKDDTFQNAGATFLNVFIGFCVLACAGAIAAAFGSGGLSADTVADISPVTLASGIASVSDFIIKMSTGIFILIAVICALKMVSTQGDQGEFDKWRKVLIANCIGVVLMFIASAIVAGVQSPNDPGAIIEEIRGLALFILTIIGFLSVIALIVAGIFLVVSIDEGLRDRAKKTVIGTLITIALVIACYAIIYTFVSVPAVSSPLL